MSRGAALSDALLTTLATPATWPLALATFLLRGGVLLVLLPILVLPSPVGLGNLLAPMLVAVVLQGVSVEVALLAGLVVLAVLAWFAVGGLVAATLEAEAARIVARDETLGGADALTVDSDPDVEAAQRRVAVRILAARAAAHLPTSAALVWGAARLVAVAYRELTSPLDVTTPIVLRVLRGAPEAIALVLALWAAGEIVGALATRRIALDGAGVAGALRDAVTVAVRRPIAVLVDFVIPTAGLAIVLLPSTLAATAAWGLVRADLRSRGDPVGATLGVVLFVSLWLAGLALIAVTAAWRSAVWSVAHRDLWTRRAGVADGEPG